VASAQNVISARAGLVHYSEGKVLLSDKEVNPKVGEFPEMKEGEILRTEDGRAEVLLTPGVVLRVAEDSAFKLIGSKLEDIRIELQNGSVLIEAGEVNKFDSIVLSLGDASIDVQKRGVFRIDANPAMLRVYDGEALVTMAGQSLTVKSGRQTALTSVVAGEKFNKETGDAFHRWSGRRSGYLALANLSAAKSVSNISAYQAGSWMFNPYFGLFTYVPAFQNYTSFYGYQYYTPRRVDAAYYRHHPGMYNSSDAWAGSSAGQFPGASGGGYSGGGRSVSSVSSAPSAAPSSAPPASSGGSSGSRSGGGR
jgi:hypothetical protein